jgi:hypothetical protein
VSQKKINYLSRDFATIKDELIKFSNIYYPELADDFNDSSVGAWFIDLVAAVGDDLSYHTDRMYQEANIDSASLKSSVLNQARANGLKIPGKKSSICEVEVSCVLPTDSTNIHLPDWNYAPILQSTSIVSAGEYNYQLTEDVNFAEQFNKDGFSNRKMTPARDGNGNITGYNVSKSTIVINGVTKIYKKVIYSSDLMPFMEVVLPESNVLNIESIIFKETSDFNTNPSTYEYYIDEEQYKIGKESVMTYRFFECDSLVDQYRFGTEANIDNFIINDIYNPHLYDDYYEIVKKDGSGETITARTSRYYRGKWKPLTQKFITEFTDNGYMKIIFGAGNTYPEVPESATTYGDYAASALINNDMMGILPKEGWTMYVLYRIGGGTSTNLGPGAINKISLANVDWGGNTGNTDGSKRGKVLTSLAVTNISTAVAGKDEPSTEEIKMLMKYSTGAQNRAVTVKDYRVKLMQMPPKYGAPFRNTVIEANNKIEMDFLGINALGQLDSALPQTLVENVIEYMSNYKQINDYIEIKSGRIYNIGLGIDVFIDKNYNPADVIKTIIEAVKEYFNVNNHEMGDDIFLGDLEKEIMLLDGVVSLISLRVYKIWNGTYSPDKCPLPALMESSACDTPITEPFNTPDGSESEQIDLMAVDKVLYGDYNSMYEIKNQTFDIQVKCKLI